MTGNEYQQLALRTRNTKLSKEETLINGAMGLCGESGEVIDLLKKHLHHGHPLDRERMLKELGDVAWYLAETAYALDYDLETVLQKNIEKLKERYPEGFSEERSLHREEAQ
ncbi:MAG: nucleoside triphosphate pyrophosphohydrolase family protein [Erysipelotrichaceae bacterium]|nr:nucleoside triphosphate pyrophosphohydrolase family protein [Erysipelotrichaceae bacterium]